MIPSVQCFLIGQIHLPVVDQTNTEQNCDEKESYQQNIGGHSVSLQNIVLTCQILIELHLILPEH